MIDPRAVTTFLKQPCDSHVWVKNLSRSKLWNALDDVGFVPISDERLDTHQLACILLGIAYPQFSYWSDMGTGKTRVILELLSYWWEQGFLKRGIVMAVSEDAVRGWEDEIRKWSFRVPYAAEGNGATADKWQAIAELGAGILITTYAGFSWMFASKVKNKKKGKVQLKPDTARIRKFAANLQACVWDESVHVGNHRSLQFQIAKRISENCPIRIAQAGVPFGRDPILTWAQQFLVDRGESLGPTLGLFRAAFFTEKRGYFGGFDYKFRKDMEPALTRLMQHRSISYSSDECLDLPPVTSIVHNIKLPRATLDYFDRFMQALRSAKGDRQKIVNIFLRMRQLSSGFIGYTDDETGEKAEVVLPSNPKLLDLLDTIEELPNDCKFVVFHEFTWSGKQIMNAFKDRGINVGWLWGGNKDRTLKQRFDEESPSRMKGLLVNHFLGAESLNLQRANYLIVYESPVGVIRRKQMEKRCFRKGQERHGFLIDLLATKTDRRILEFHKDGADLMRALIRDPYRALAV